MCGGPVPPGKRRPRKVCDNPECKRAQNQWAVSREERIVRARREALTGERTCKHCGETKPLDREHFPYSNRSNGRTYYRRVCRMCWTAYYNRFMQRRYREALKADPVRHARMLESERLKRKMRQERETGRVSMKRGAPAANAYKPVISNSADALPVEPFAVWLEQVIDREVPDFGLSRGGSDRDGRSRTEEDLAAELGVDVRRLYRVRAREHKRVSLGIIDSMIVRYGKPITIDGERAARRLAERCREMPGNGERILRYIDLAERIAHLDGAVIDRVEDLYQELA